MPRPTRKIEILNGSELPLFNRDISWLAFNTRVLNEARDKQIPVLERVRFLAIYSSNLDEFFRVRMPAIMAEQKVTKGSEGEKIKTTISAIHNIILAQQREFGEIMESELIPELRKNKIHLYYKENITGDLKIKLRDYFMDTLAAYLTIFETEAESDFFPENNKLYLAIIIHKSVRNRKIVVVNVPSDSIARFFTIQYGQETCIFFLEDIIKSCLNEIFPGEENLEAYSFKVTRNSDLNLTDEFSGNLARQIERKIIDRDSGFATRFLYEPGLPGWALIRLAQKADLVDARQIAGGHYHNLKDLNSLPVQNATLSYPVWPRVSFSIPEESSLFIEIRRRDVLLHPPYSSYTPVLRFFNEAALDPAVKTIYITLYRIAQNSQIAASLISAARNGKEVVVFIELKARFDEENNLKWSKKMRAAGIRIIESLPGLKVHAKLALVVRQTGSAKELIGLFATGNFNENTAKYYTDHVLFTANEKLLKESETLFQFLKSKRQPDGFSKKFQELLVGKFNLQQRFIELIDREVTNHSNGLPSGIIIKLNNLEDKVLIGKLYEASSKGVKIRLLIRGICCLVPGIDSVSENIQVTRIIDRYLEHGRIFVFENGGQKEIWMGSADWMNRNLYRRIEVCFPVYLPQHKAELLDFLTFQLSDTAKAVELGSDGTNIPVEKKGKVVRSQMAIAEYFASKKQK